VAASGMELSIPISKVYLRAMRLPTSSDSRAADLDANMALKTGDSALITSITRWNRFSQQSCEKVIPPRLVASRAQSRLKQGPKNGRREVNPVALRRPCHKLRRPRYKPRRSPPNCPRHGRNICWFLGGAAMWIDSIDTMMHIEGQGEDGGSRVLAAMWLPSWQRAAAKIGATPKLQHRG
jgi:hypothetical protein